MKAIQSAKGLPPTDGLFRCCEPAPASRSGRLRLVYGHDPIENLAEIALRDLNVIIVLQIEPKLGRCAECLGEPKRRIGGDGRLFSCGSLHPRAGAAPGPCQKARPPFLPE